MVFTSLTILAVAILVGMGGCWYFAGEAMRKAGEALPAGDTGVAAMRLATVAMLLAAALGAYALWK